MGTGASPMATTLDQLGVYRAVFPLVSVETGMTQHLSRLDSVCIEQPSEFFFIREAHIVRRLQTGKQRQTQLIRTNQQEKRYMYRIQNKRKTKTTVGTLILAFSWIIEKGSAQIARAL